MFERNDHVEVIPSDSDRTLTLYQEVLGARPVSRIPIQGASVTEIACVQLGDTVVEALNMPGAAPKPATPTVGYCSMALEVDSTDVAKTDLADHGIAIT